MTSRHATSKGWDPDRSSKPRRPVPPAASTIPLRAPLSPALLTQVQRTAGNGAASQLVLQRHDIDTPAGELDEMEEAIQRIPMTQAEMTEAEAKVTTAIDGAADVKKSRNPILHNTGKAIKKGGISTSVHDQPTWKAQVSGSSTTIRLGGQWVRSSQVREIQGALAHEVAHILKGPGLDEFQDEFNAYWAEVMAGSADATARVRTPAEMATKLPAIQNVLKKYGWWGTAAPAQQLVWEAITQPTGFNLSSSWKQKRLLDKMNASAPAAEVITLIKSMDKTDRAEARDAKRPAGTHYLPYGNYPADKTRIWKALGGAGAAP